MSTETIPYELSTAPRADAPQTARKYHIWTIGCQMNVADSNHVAAELEKIGYSPTEALDEADVLVLNTCVVRQSAEEKAVGKLGNLKPWKRAKSERTLALMGCMVGVKPSPQLIKQYPFVDVFMSPSEATPLINHLCQEQIDAEMAEIEREQLAQRYQIQDEEGRVNGQQSAVSSQQSTVSSQQSAVNSQQSTSNNQFSILHSPFSILNWQNTVDQTPCPQWAGSGGGACADCLWL